MQNLHLRFPDDDTVLEVRDFRVEEAMSKPFEIFLTVRSNEALDLAGLVAQKARFEAALRQASTDLPLGAVAAGYSADWNGIVANIEEFGVESTGVFLYRVHVVHPLWILSQNKNYRVFQHLSELDIARALLAEWAIGDSVLIDLDRYKKRDYRIQYGESDLDFVHRNLEDLGVSYYLEDLDGQEIVTFSASPEKNEPRKEALRYYDEPPRFERSPWVTGVAVRRALRAAKYTLQDVDYRYPPDRQPRISQELKKDGDAPIAHRVSAIERALETYEYNPGIFCVEGKGGGDTPSADRRLATRTDDKYGQWLTEVRLRSIQSTRYRIHFETNAFDLHPGTVARIDDHPRPELADPVLVIASTFTGSDTGEWNMVCVAHPTQLPFMPEMVTPRPCATGVETATVVGLPGQKIDPQELGSVLVQFHWDREGMRDEKASCWVPVSYGLAGPGRGMFSLPRVGEEVLVDFLAGDLDKPMVTGRVYTGLNKPWTKDVRKMGDFSIKNDSLDDASQNTGIHMTADAKPLMHLFTTHDKQLTVGNDQNSKVTRNRTATIGGNDSIDVTGVRNVTSGSTMGLRAGSLEAADLIASASFGVSVTADASDLALEATETNITLKAPKANIDGTSKIVSFDAEERIVLSVGKTKLVLTKTFALLEAEETFINPGPDAAATAAFMGTKPTTAAEDQAEWGDLDWQDIKNGEPEKRRNKLAARTKAREEAIRNESLRRWPPDARNAETGPKVRETIDELERLYPPATSPYWDNPCRIDQTPLYSSRSEQ